VRTPQLAEAFDPSFFLFAGSELCVPVFDEGFQPAVLLLVEVGERFKELQQITKMLCYQTEFVEFGCGGGLVGRLISGFPVAISTSRVSLLFSAFPEMERTNALQAESRWRLSLAARRESGSAPDSASSSRAMSRLRTSAVRHLARRGGS
jgi:hypothetical protein